MLHKNATAQVGEEPGRRFCRRQNGQLKVAAARARAYAYARRICARGGGVNADSAAR